MSDNQTDVRRIFGQRAAFYTKSVVHTDKEILGRVVELSQPQPDWLVLDIGTGTGHTALALAPHVRTVYGLDLTPEMLAEADRLAEEQGIVNYRSVLGDAHQLPFDDGLFDLVTCRRAAHHFADIDTAMSEMARVLKPGGRLVIDDRSSPEDDWADALMDRLDRLHDASHVRQYRPSEWQELYADAGLSVEVVEGYVRHRPVSALTQGADDKTAQEIEKIIASLDAGKAEALGAYPVDGEMRHNHWYVMVSGLKQA